MTTRGVVCVALVAAMSSCGTALDTTPPTDAEELGSIDPTVPVGVFQRVAWRVLAEAQRGHEAVIPLGVLDTARVGYCVPDRQPCEWVTRDVPLPEQLRNALREFEQPIAFVSRFPPVCRDELVIGFTNARRASETDYIVTIDLFDTRSPDVYIEEGREYTARCNPQYGYCEIRNIVPGDEPDVEIRYGPEEECSRPGLRPRLDLSRSSLRTSP